MQIKWTWPTKDQCTLCNLKRNKMSCFVIFLALNLGKLGIWYNPSMAASASSLGLILILIHREAKKSHFCHFCQCLHYFTPISLFQNPNLPLPQKILNRDETVHVLTTCVWNRTKYLQNTLFSNFQDFLHYFIFLQKQVKNAHLVPCYSTQYWY